MCSMYIRGRFKVDPSSKGCIEKHEAFMKELGHTIKNLIDGSRSVILEIK